jgi:N-acyl homoserine lactone hydrolase
MVKGLYLLPGGTLELDKSIIMYRTDMGKKVRIPVVVSLVETSEGSVLFDTGLNPKGLLDPSGTWGEKAPLVVEFTAADDVRNRLKELGIKPEDVSYVVNSHLHYDHTGGNQYFPKAKFIVQKAEYRFALLPDDFAAGAYMRDHFDHPYDYRFIEGDHELLPGITLLFSPGHTPGSQAMLVRLPESGNVCLTGDVVYCLENIGRNLPAGNCWDPGQAMMSMKRLTQLAKRENAALFITHQPGIWERLKPAPYCYR